MYIQTQTTLITARGKGEWGLGGSGQEGEKPGMKGTLGNGHMMLCGGDVLLRVIHLEPVGFCEPMLPQ